MYVEVSEGHTLGIERSVGKVSQEAAKLTNHHEVLDITLENVVDLSKVTYQHNKRVTWSKWGRVAMLDFAGVMHQP